MNKNMIKKVILILSLIALFSIVLGGCTITGFVTIPTKGTVYITVDESYRRSFVPTGSHNYNIVMDDDYIDTIEAGEILKIYNVLLGNHTFEAWGVYPDVNCYGFVSQEIVSGTNSVSIPVYTY